MPCYLAVRNNGEALPAFTDRKIPDLMPGALDDVQIDYTGTCNSLAPFISYVNHVADAHIPSFEALKTNAQDFARVQLANAHSRVLGLFSNVFKKMTLTRLFNVPTAAFTFDGDLADDQKASLHSYGLMESNEIKDSFVGSPPASSLSAIFSMGLIDKRLPPGFTQPAAYLAYTYLIKAYNIYSEAVDKLSPTTSFYVVSEEGMMKKGEDVMIPSWGNKTPTSKYSGAYSGGGDTVISGNVTPIVSSWDSTKTIKGVYLDLSDVSKLKSSVGQFFPYFEGMNLPDKSSIGHLFASVFFRGLGDTSLEASQVWSKVKSGIRALSATSAGMALAHLYMGMKLSMTSTTRIIAVLNGGLYQGFILTGPSEFLMWGKVYKSIPNEQLQREVGELNRQERILGEILAILNAPVKDDGGMPWYLFTKGDINSSRRLTKTWQSVEKNLYGPLERGNLIKLVDELVWSEKFAPPSQSSILAFLNFIHTGMTEILDQYPAYVQGGYFMNDGRVARGLSMFGPKAPSINIAPIRDSLVFNIPNKMETEDPNLKVGDDKKRITLRYLPFAFVAIRSAENQWNALFKSGRIHLYKPRGGKNEFTNTSQYAVNIGSSPFFETAYSQIKEHSIHVRAGLAGGKRARADDDDESGPSSSRKRSKKDNMTVGLVI